MEILLLQTQHQEEAARTRISYLCAIVSIAFLFGCGDNNNEAVETSPNTPIGEDNALSANSFESSALNKREDAVDAKKVNADPIRALRNEVENISILSGLDEADFVGESEKLIQVINVLRGNKKLENQGAAGEIVIRFSNEVVKRLSVEALSPESAISVLSKIDYPTHTPDEFIDLVYRYHKVRRPSGLRKEYFIAFAQAEVLSGEITLENDMLMAGSENMNEDPAWYLAANNSQYTLLTVLGSKSYLAAAKAYSQFLKSGGVMSFEVDSLSSAMEEKIPEVLEAVRIPENGGIGDIETMDGARCAGSILDMLKEAE